MASGTRKTAGEGNNSLRQRKTPAQPAPTNAAEDDRRPDEEVNPPLPSNDEVRETAAYQILRPLLTLLIFALLYGAFRYLTAETPHDPLDDYDLQSMLCSEDMENCDVDLVDNPVKVIREAQRKSREAAAS